MKPTRTVCNGATLRPMTVLLLDHGAAVAVLVAFLPARAKAALLELGPRREAENGKPERRLGQ